MSSTGNFTVAGTGIVSSSRSLGAGLAIAGSVVAGRASVNTWQRTNPSPLQRDAARAPLLYLRRVASRRGPGPVAAAQPLLIAAALLLGLASAAGGLGGH